MLTAHYGGRTFEFKYGDDILEYTLEGSEITVNWVSGKGASTMMKSILKVDGAGVKKIPDM